ncbi:ferrous iron transport protein A [Metabacillus sp. GX 13764]|uniref:FeoA family protein n=1 Tax=Metabacillus kandeliae TaxID=2900151 RepID=UPI001E2A7BF7|nr:FeoA family protein [Metabacillus kandeliae]MCD7035072.1 ferrous iron transport protein A [Metabacillus kandeliae]
MTQTYFPLSNMKKGDRFKIVSITIEGTQRRRLLDLGFVPGAIIEVLQKSPLGDPTAYHVSSTTIALRKEESSKIYGERVNV